VKCPHYCKDDTSCTIDELTHSFSCTECSEGEILNNGQCLKTCPAGTFL
jgi:hypothetical protein